MRDALYYDLLLQHAEAKARYVTLTKILEDLDQEETDLMPPPKVVLVDSFAEAIRAARKSLGYTQEQLAKMVGLSPNGGGVMISRYENGLVIPSKKTMEKLERALYISLHTEPAKEES